MAKLNANTHIQMVEAGGVEPIRLVDTAQVIHFTFDPIVPNISKRRSPLYSGYTAERGLFERGLCSESQLL